MDGIRIVQVNMQLAKNKPIMLPLSCILFYISNFLSFHPLAPLFVVCF